MKAVRINQWGEQVRVEEVPLPEYGQDEVLVRVRAASINPADAALVSGLFSFMATAPMTVGTDFAGEVVAVGADVTHVVPGDEVYGLVVARSGTFAEYTTARPNEVARKPKALDFHEASTVPLPALAAWQMLFDHAQLQDGERVLIHGAGGNVGSFAIQFAKAKNAYIYGVDIPQRADYLRDLGIDRYIDPAVEQFEDVAENVDVVLDLVGGKLMDRSYTVLKPGGRYVTSLMMQTPQEEPEKRQIRSLGLATQPRTDRLEHFAELFDAGKLKVLVNRTFPLDQAQAAMDYRVQATAPGKVVLAID